MPWKMKIAESGFAALSSDDTKAGSQISPVMIVAFSGYLTPAGTAGSTRSVRISLYSGSLSRRAARRGPMKPPAPVMMMFFGIGGIVYMTCGLSLPSGIKNTGEIKVNLARIQGVWHGSTGLKFTRLTCSA